MKRLARIILCLFAASLIFIYIGSYFYLSRRGMAEASAVNFPGFFYVPMSEIGCESTGLKTHYQLTSFYSPLNDLDQAYFGGWCPVTGMTWRFDAKRESEELRSSTPTSTP
jgi:hypothetical protein